MRQGASGGIDIGRRAHVVDDSRVGFSATPN